MKTMLLYLRPRCQNPKMIGLATASNSALTVHDMRRLAEKEKGKFFIIEDENAESARKKIKSILKYFKNAKSPIQNTPELNLRTFDNGHTVTIGEKAHQAILGAQISISNWDTNIETQGRVYIHQSKAL